MSDFDFELENINASSDLVTFRPVRDCYSNDYRIRLQWDIGDCFDPEALDYVGLFNTEWNSVDDYLAYKWAPLIPQHAYTLRRRSVQFTDADFDVSIKLTLFFSMISFIYLNLNYKTRSIQSTSFMFSCCYVPRQILIPQSSHVFKWTR